MCHSVTSNPTSRQVHTVTHTLLKFESISSLFRLFQVSGELRDGGARFVWSHSYSRVFQHLKQTPYNTSGPFLQFANLIVENRPRVKCTNAKDSKIYQNNKLSQKSIS